MFPTVYNTLTVKRLGIASVLSRMLLFFMVFTQFYALRLKGLHTSTRIILSLFGVALFFYTAIKEHYNKGKLVIPRPIIGLGILYLPIMIVSLIAIAINGTNDFEFVKYPISPVITIFSAYITISFARNIYPQLTFSKIAVYVIQIVFVQAILSVAMYYNKGFHDALYSFVEMDALETMITKKVVGMRLLGYGANLMMLGIGNDIALLLIAILLKDRKKQILGPSVNNFWLIFSFIFISIIGMMQARTTTLGILFSLAYLFFPQIKKVDFTHFFTGIKSLGSIVLYTIIIAGIFTIFFPQFLKSSQGLLGYGFEMVNNYEDKGTLSTESTDGLIWMYSVYPKTLHTWLIGDAKFYRVAGDTSSLYYMGIDIGYLRLIFYFGVIGCFTYIFYQLAFIWQSFSYLRKYYQLIPYYFMIYILFFNAKSFIDMTQYVALFWVFGFYYNKQLQEKNN